MHGGLDDLQSDLDGSRRRRLSALDSQRESGRNRRRGATAFLVVVIAIGAAAAGFGLQRTAEDAAPLAAGAETSRDIVEDLVAREARRPEFLNEEMANASLAALTSNGMLERLVVEREDLSARDSARFAELGDSAGEDDVLLPIVHYVDCGVDACSAVIDWAQGQGLDVSKPVQSQGHGGVDLFHVEISQIVPASGAAIATQADWIFLGVASLSDETIRYAGWAPDTGKGRS